MLAGLFQGWETGILYLPAIATETAAVLISRDFRSGLFRFALIRFSVLLPRLQWKFGEFF